MRSFVARLGWAVVTLLGTSLLVFAMAHALPADPVAAMVGPRADAETRERIARELGLRDPFWTQYLRYVGHAARGDLGRSAVTGERVADALRTRFPTTLALALGGLGWWLALGIPLGVLTARWRNSRFDHTVLVVAMVAVSIPTFWLGRMLQWELAYRRGIFPVAGYVDWRHMVLPSLTLGGVGAGYYARLVHSNMVEVLNQDYVRSARAKGVAEARVLFRHALPNALLPVLTVLGMDVAALLGGVVFTESVFALPGVGMLALHAVLKLDVPMMMGTVLFAAALVVAANIIVDLIYRLVDPRISAGA
jgi:peptide/nickel transport system permease protein